MPVEQQRLDAALAGEEDTIGQEHAEIRIAGARLPGSVLHLDLIGETPGYQEEVGVHDRRAVVRDPIDVLLPPAAANAVGLDRSEERRVGKECRL